MAGPGGYRKPANPAPVSGPGALSQRTDGRQPIMDLPDAGYGDNAEFRTQQAGAALPQTQAPPSPAVGAPAPPVEAAPAPPGAGGGEQMTPPAPLTAGTSNPFQSVTAGADAGAGPGSEALNLAPPPAQKISDVISLYSQGDITGSLGDLYQLAVQQGR